MTDNEIIKALECCVTSKCGDCPIFYNDEVRRVPGRCVVTLEKNALDLIKRLQAEKEALIAGQETMSKYIEEQQAEIERLQSILLRFMDEVAKWEEKHGLDVSELPLIPICDEGRDIIDRYRKRAIEQFVDIFLKKVHDNHYLLVDRINSKDYGMFTIGIEQAVDETKKEMVGDTE